MNSYQKLKKQNQDLQKELMIVCCDPDSYTGRLISQKYKTLKAVEAAIWFGDYFRQGNNESKGFGIAGQVFK